MEHTFLDMPNKMYPGTWVLLAVVLLGILGGFTYMLVRYLKSRVKWKRLPGTTAKYFGKSHEPNVELLAACHKKSAELLAKHSQYSTPPGGLIKWSLSAVTKALSDARIYVMDEDKWVDEWGRKVAGIQAGRNLIVGRNLAAFLHECAHRCEEVIDKERDMDHVTWVADGIRAAEDEFAVWLSGQKL